MIEHIGKVQVNEMEDKTEFRLISIEGGMEKVMRILTETIAVQAKTDASQEHMFVQMGELKAGLAGVASTLDALRSKLGQRWDALIQTVLSIFAAPFVAYVIVGAR